jgi:hypothetical protein
MAKLMAGWARFLPLYAAILILLAGIATHPAHAKLGPISIRSVYTTDENQNNKNVFMPGDKINYRVDVDNTTASAFPIDIRFQAFENGLSPDPDLYHYDQTYRAVQMPVGLSRFYNPVTLPSNDAISKHLYAVRITITPSGCSGTNCTNDGDWGENTFTVQMTKAPEGKAPNLVVLVHGCCTDANGVKEWNTLADAIKTRINNTEWEVVVWDWHEYTPWFGVDPEGFRHGGDVAYQAAKQQGPILANAIKLYSYKYKHVHFIGFSAGAKLIHDAATAYIYDYFIRQQNPFIHLTFLDAYTPNEWDQKGEGSYGSLPTNYKNHYSEHYVDVNDIALFTNSYLQRAYNFDITDCPSSNSS